jgi:hypothetical protein
MQRHTNHMDALRSDVNHEEDEVLDETVQPPDILRKVMQSAPGGSRGDIDLRRARGQFELFEPVGLDGVAGVVYITKQFYNL